MARGKRRIPSSRRAGEADPSARSAAGVPSNPTPGPSSSSAGPSSSNDLSAVLDQLATLREQVAHLSGSQGTAPPSEDIASPSEHTARTAPSSRRTLEAPTAAPAVADSVDTAERASHRGRLPQPTGPCANEDPAVLEVPRACVHLGRALLHKITRAEFVDFAALLPSRTAVGHEANSTRLRVVPDDEGGDTVVVTSSATPRRRVDSLATWLEAWSVYAAARIHAAPKLAPQLLAYQCFIASAVKQYPVPAVLAYDASFRQLIAKDPTMRWDKRDVDLYVQVFTGSWSRAPPAGGSDRPLFDRTTEDVPICRRFNSRAGCPFGNCTFAHCCNRCRGPHSAATTSCDGSTA